MSSTPRLQGTLRRMIIRLKIIFRKRSIFAFHFQITVTVPITLMTPMSESGQAIFPENHIHKIFCSISSNVEDVSVIC